MTLKISLGKCNDPQVKHLANMLQQKTISTGYSTIVNGKSYLVTPKLIVTRNSKEDLGEVYKFYRRGLNNDWYLKTRQVANERGSYSRSIDFDGQNIRYGISLGGQDCFIQQKDGTFVQTGIDKYKAQRATIEEIEAAINYIKGIGTKEYYIKLLRQ